MNWLELYHNIEKIKHKKSAYIINEDSDRIEYVKDASHSLTLQFIELFHEKTRLFSELDKLKYIESLDIQSPMLADSGNNTRDYMHFKAQNNFSEFIQELKHEIITRISEKQKKRLTISQIALKCVYEGRRVTRKNASVIAMEHGHVSGEKLYQKFIFFSSKANRRGKPVPFTPKKLKNKIELFETVIDTLPPEKRELALDEVKILKNNLENDIL